LFRTPYVKGLYAAALLARFPAGINAIAVLLFFRSEGRTFTEAGLIVASLGLGLAVGSPITSRLYDRRGLSVLRLLAAIHGTGLGLLIVLGITDAPAILVMVLALLIGMAVPPVVPVFRAAMGFILRNRSGLLSTAYAVESMALELIFVGGPAVAAGFLMLGTPALALVVSALTGVTGTVWFSGLLQRRLLDEEAEARSGLGGRARASAKGDNNHWAGALKSRGLLTLVLSTFPLGFAFGAIEIILPAFADDQGEPAAAGWLISSLAVGSLIGAFTYGALPRRPPLVVSHLVAAATLPCLTALLWLADTTIHMAILAAIVSLPIASLLAINSELAGKLGVEGRETEAQAWPWMCLMAGVAMGTAATGAIVDAGGWSAAVTGSVIAGAISAIISFSGRKSMASSEGQAIARSNPDSPVSSPNIEAS